jgi:hypothetical protein
MRSLLFLAVAVLLAPLANAQWKEITRFKSEFKVLSVSVDRPGDFYIATAEPSISKYEPSGSRTANTKTPSPATIFDPRDGARPFVFFRDLGYCGIMAPSLTSLPSTTPLLNSAFAISPYLVCSVGDHQLAILDSADWSLKKVNPKTEVVVIEQTLPDSLVKTPDFISMREYQNFIFLLDRNIGIHVFNGLGKLVRTIPAKGLNAFNFLGEELYYIQGDELRFFDLFSAETRTVKLPLAPDFAILTDQRLFTVTKDLVQIFELTP